MAGTDIIKRTRSDDASCGPFHFSDKARTNEILPGKLFFSDDVDLVLHKETELPVLIGREVTMFDLNLTDGICEK